MAFKRRSTRYGKRHKLGKRHSKKMFSHHARKVHKLNLHSNPVRGGFRL